MLHETAGEPESCASRLSLPVPTAIVSDALGSHPDFRVLKRIGALDTSSIRPVGAITTGCALDVETTGLSSATSRVIELAVQRFGFDEEGRIVRVGQPRSWLEDPGMPVPPEVTTVTGLRDKDLRGRRIDDQAATAILRSAQVIVSHNAAFDRPFVERRLPDAAGAAWACSLQDVPWRDIGFEGRSLGHLLVQCGWFYEAHRAQVDVLALLHLLDHDLGETGRVLRIMLQQAQCPTVELAAIGATFGGRQMMKQRGYRWNSQRDTWTISVPLAGAEQESEWAEVNLYHGLGKPHWREVTWKERYAG